MPNHLDRVLHLLVGPVAHDYVKEETELLYLLECIGQVAGSRAELLPSRCVLDEKGHARSTRGGESSARIARHGEGGAPGKLDFEDLNVCPADLLDDTDTA